MIKLFPSLISGDLLHLAEEIKRLEPQVDGFHLDIMDAHFVPNLTWGPCFINAIRQATSRQLWVHLMVDSPGNYLNKLQLAPDDIISLHYEGLPLTVTQKLLEHIGNQGQIPSIALKPTTPIGSLLPLFENPSTSSSSVSPGFVAPGQVLVMSVEPGASGQTMLPTTQERLQELQQFKQEHRLNFTIAVDGGVTTQNIGMLAQHGVQEVAVAAAIFNAPDQFAAIKILQRA